MPGGNFEDQMRQVSQQCLARKVRQASRQICAIYDEALRPFGLKASQFNLLIAIGCQGETTPGILQQAMSLEKSTVSRNVERMAAKGWLLSRKRQDQRALHYRLSSKGRALVERALPAWREAERDIRDLLGQERVGALDRLVNGIIPGINSA